MTSTTQSRQPSSLWRRNHSCKSKSTKLLNWHCAHWDSTGIMHLRMGFIVYYKWTWFRTGQWTRGQANPVAIYLLEVYRFASIVKWCWLMKRLTALHWYCTDNDDIYCIKVSKYVVFYYLWLYDGNNPIIHNSVVSFDDSCIWKTN